MSKAKWYTIGRLMKAQRMQHQITPRKMAHYLEIEVKEYKAAEKGESLIPDSLYGRFSLIIALGGLPDIDPTKQEVTITPTAEQHAMTMAIFKGLMKAKLHDARQEQKRRDELEALRQANE